MHTTQISASEQRLFKIQLIFIILYITKPISVDNVGVNVVCESMWKYWCGWQFSLVQKPQFWDLYSCIWVPRKKPMLLGLKYDKLTTISMVLNYIQYIISNIKNFFDIKL